MFRVTLPSNTVFVSPEQLPRFIANVAETRYVTESGEFLQTTSKHELVSNELTTATLLVKQVGATSLQERDHYRDLWEQTRANLEKANTRIEKLEAGKKPRKRR